MDLRRKDQSLPVELLVRIVTARRIVSSWPGREDLIPFQKMRSSSVCNSSLRYQTLKKIEVILINIIF